MVNGPITINATSESGKDSIPTVKLSEAGEYIAKRQPFHAGNLHASIVTGATYPHGQLSPQHRMVMLNDFHRYGGRLYVVWSYETPIAWGPVEPHDLRVPDVRYSQTTRRHQGICERSA